MMDIVLRVAAKAVIVDQQGCVLILREAVSDPDGTNPGKYHLPGGRLESGEAFLDGLHREVQEETGLKITPRHPVHVDEWRPVIHGQKHQIIAIFMCCDFTGGEVRLSEEHDEFHWIDPREHQNYPLLPEDRAAIVSNLRFMNEHPAKE